VFFPRTPFSNRNPPLLSVGDYTLIWIGSEVVGDHPGLSRSPGGNEIAPVFGCQKTSFSASCAERGPPIW